MADTQPLAPTDADIDALWAEQQLTVPQLVQRRAIARAVLAKWGAQPVAPVWTPASTPPKEEDGEVLVRMADGRCEIAWATYWHGSSNAFAQWTFRDPDEDEQPVEWMHIPKHGATAPQPVAREPLTDKQIEAAVAPLYKDRAAQLMGRADDIATARAIELAHGITKGGKHDL